MQALSREQAEYCVRRMKPYKAPAATRSSVPSGALDYKQFAQTMFTGT